MDVDAVIENKVSSSLHCKTIESELSAFILKGEAAPSDDCNMK